MVHQLCRGAGGVNNILVYHDNGRPHARPHLLPTGKDDPPLQEVRGFAAAGRLLYVVNADESLSQILVYEGDAGDGYRFQKILASMTEVSSLVHPYDLTFDEQGNCYVSSQDTNVVTGLRAGGGVLEVAAHLRQLYPPPHTFLVGTRVASSFGLLPGIQAPHPPDVGVPHGLDVGFEDHTRTRVAHSVRGVVCHGGHLYVADEPGDAVKVYEVENGRSAGRLRATTCARRCSRWWMKERECSISAAAGTTGSCVMTLRKGRRRARSRPGRLFTAR